MWSGMSLAWKSVTSLFSKPKSNDPEETPDVFDSFDTLQSNDCVPETPECSQRLADAVKDESTLLEPQSGPIPVYKIPLQEEDIAMNGCKRFRFGKESHGPNRTIMVLGATGAGKSTLINGMINYILGVEWNDPYRFKLVDEGQSTSQAHSQTTEVTTYKLNHRDGFKIQNSLTIVDTPGFGDTRGIKKDKLIVEQLRHLFSAQSGVSEIDAVCFVAQASLARLTPTQKYVFDSVLSIFGKDVAENIQILVTFADGQHPPVLEAINEAGVPCPKTKEGLPVHFKFNNSALFAQNKRAAESASGEDDEGGFDEMFWNMGIKSMRRFFTALNVMTTKSLTMTKDVLRERQQLKILVQSLQKQVKIGLGKLEEIKETATQLKDHEAEISRNKDFVIELKVNKAFQYDISGSGTFLTNCQQCHFTCHDNCAFANDADKIRCCAMGPDGFCKMCPGKCVWSVHYNQKYRWEYKEVTERQTVKELEDKYLGATGAKMSVETLIDRLKAEYDLMKAEVVKVIGDSAKCLNRLKEIALRPNPLSTPEYIDMLIEGEKAEAKSGWKERVQYLINMREHAEFMAKVERGEEFLQSSSRDFQSFLQGPTKDGADQDTTDTTNEKGVAEQDQDENDQDQDENDKDQVNTEDQDQDENDEDQDQNETDEGQDKNDEDQDQNETDEGQDKNDEDQDQNETDESQDENDEDQDQNETDEGQDENDKDQDQNETDEGQDENDEDQDQNETDEGQDKNDEDQDQNETDEGQDKNDEDQDQNETDEGQDENDKDQVNTEDKDQDEDQELELDSNESFEDQDPDIDSNNDQDEKDSDSNQDVAHTATETD